MTISSGKALEYLERIEKMSDINSFDFLFEFSDSDRSTYWDGYRDAIRRMIGDLENELHTPKLPPV